MGLLGRTSDALLDGDALASELAAVLGLAGDEDEPQDDASYTIGNTLKFFLEPSLRIGVATVRGRPEVG